MASNPYADAARARKVAHLVDFITANVQRAASDYGAAETAAFLRQQPAEWWAEVAVQARINMPSAETQAEVVASFERRALWEQEDPFARCRKVAS